jgi:hypothetical protein
MKDSATKSATSQICKTKHRNPCEDCLLFTGFLCFGSADLRSHEALTGLRVSADLQKQICLRKSAEPLWASLKNDTDTAESKQESQRLSSTLLDSHYRQTRNLFTKKWRPEPTQKTGRHRKAK